MAEQHAESVAGPTISQEWQDKAGWLFQNIPPWETTNDQPPVVCVTHKRFIPCRTCMYAEIAKVPYSSNPLDVAIVRIHQQGARIDGRADGDDV